jgi:hypothetical protein
VRPRAVRRWYSLTEPERSGTDEQRRFVELALGTPDFAFLDGPPGSGKTTAICELIQQLVAEGKRVLLCGSTHYSIDNVLERVGRGPVSIDCVRIGRVDRVDEGVREFVLSERVQALVAQWRAAGQFESESDATLAEMAERVLTAAGDLTCATTMGIASHPLFRDEAGAPWEKPIAKGPAWDVLIVDEASKTLAQEFLVPAMMARRWVIVGDVRQLPPFTDRDELAANIEALAAEEGAPLSDERSRARLVLFRLAQRARAHPESRWLVVEPAGVLRACVEAIAEDVDRELAPPWRAVVRVVRAKTTASPVCTEVTAADVREGRPQALALSAADLVLVEDDLVVEIQDRLPATLLPHRDVGRKQLLGESSPWVFRQRAWLERTARSSARPSEKQLDEDQKWLETKRLEGEVAWRIARVHELRHRRNERETDRLQDELEALLPGDDAVHGAIEEIEDVGLPSILEVLREGIGEERAGRASALTAGMYEDVYRARAAALSVQNRMHPEISEFARRYFYEDRSLRDANTLAERDRELRWTYDRHPRRRVWIEVVGDERDGRNAAEVSAARDEIEAFLRWVKLRGGPDRPREPRWVVACLSFYGAQQRALGEMLQKLTGDRERQTRFEHRELPVEFVCGTVDRFQGREADLVLLSLRNTRRIGFLDSPNRLNVALTRARQQLVILGNHRFFSRCRVDELRELAARTTLIERRTR